MQSFPRLRSDCELLDSSAIFWKNMKKACISLILTIALSSNSLTQTNPAHTTYPASTLSNGINLRAVAGAPSWAAVVSQSRLRWAHGTPVTQETHGKMFRDSAGRTRSEIELQS